MLKNGAHVACAPCSIPSALFAQFDLTKHRGEAPRAVASSVGVVTETLAGWVRAARSGAWEGVLGVAAERTTLPEGLPDDPEALKAIIRDMQMRLDIAREVVEVVKKDPGADPAALTNREKALVVNALRGDYSVTSLTSRLGMAGSCHRYWRVRLAEPDPLAGLRREVLRVFEASGRAWGYRRVWRQLRSEGTRVSEKVVRRLMREGGMAVAYDRKRRRAYDSYAGEVSDRPPNLPCVEEAGREPGHAFEAALPNEVWVTGITEFRLPCGAKVYLSPVLDCFDGRLASWGIGLHPTAALAEGALREACAALAEGEAPVVHSDGGVQYRVAGWEACCEEHGLSRSMSRKGRSCDNARMEGFFGTLKNTDNGNRAAGEDHRQKCA